MDIGAIFRLLKPGKYSNDKGFTLIELTISMVIISIVVTSIYSIFTSQNKTYTTNEQIAQIQQNGRIALEMIARDLINTGYDPSKANQSAVSPLFGVTEIRFRNKYNRFNVNGNGAITITADLNGDGTLDSGNDLWVDYSLKDAYAPGDGDLDLVRRLSSGGGRQPLAENIDAMEFAFAYDADGDGEVDSSGGNIIWAVDIDNSQTTWTDLDGNGDGIIDESDSDASPGSSSVITGRDTNTAIDLNDIRAVRIWILARSERGDPDYINRNTYVVGRRIITPNDSFRRRLFETTVYCRNMGLL